MQIRAEGVRADRALEIPVRCRHDPHVDVNGLSRSNTLDLLILQDAQQLGLSFGRQVADLVQEQRPAVGNLELARFADDGAREGAPFVPEELALHERFGKRKHARTRSVCRHQLGGILRATLASIAVIAIGLSLLVGGGAVAAQYSRLLTKAEPGYGAQLRRRARAWRQRER